LEGSLLKTNSKCFEGSLLKTNSKCLEGSLEKKLIASA
jgi:hypothetical protein